MTLPVLTDEQRVQALQKAVAARQARAEVKTRLKAGTVTLSDVLAEGAGDGMVAGIKVTALLESMPGVGKIRAGQIMDRLGIARSRRVRGLGPNQRQALEAEFAA